MTLKLIQDLIKTLKSLVKSNNIDQGGVGNEVGIVIAKHLNSDQLRDFIAGIEHGISLIQGSHDSDDVDKFLISTKIYVSDKRKEDTEKTLRLFGG